MSLELLPVLLVRIEFKVLFTGSVEKEIPLLHGSINHLVKQRNISVFMMNIVYFFFSQQIKLNFE